ncbi:MAG TPA: GNAT family protein [Rectinemataceae bacterium]|nr:GNAT family protein [Rectinemataceae bacterium]
MLVEALTPGIKIMMLEKRHAAAMLRFVDGNRGYFEKWIPFVSKNHELGEIEAFIRRLLGQYAEGSGYFFGLWNDDAMIGFVLIKDIREDVKAAEIGYMIDEKFQGRGIVKAACLRMIKFLFEERMAQKIVLCCDERNERSIALAKRLGFVLEGNLRRDSLINDEICNTLHFGLLRDEYLA